MPYATLAQAMRVSAECEGEDHRNRLRDGAFLAWQLVQTKEPLSFGDYLRQLGLDSEREELSRMTPEQRTAERDEAIANAERVMARMKGQTA